MVKTKTVRWALISGAALVLAGCASQQRTEPQIKLSTDSKGAKIVEVAPESVLCSRPQCPQLSGIWTSNKPGQAVLHIGLPYQQAQVTGADFYFGAQEVLRVRSRTEQQPNSTAIPTTAFDVPLHTIERIAGSTTSWVRVYTDDGRSVDENINTGEEVSRAFTGMYYFVNHVLAAGGKGSGAPVGEGGLIDRLGLGDKKSR